MAPADASERWNYLISIERHDQALQEVQLELVAEPHDPQLLRFLAHVQLSRGALEEAEVAIRSSLAEESESEWGLRLLASVLLSSGRAAQAVLVAQDALRVGPTPAAVFLLGQGLRVAKAGWAALGVAKLFVAFDPSSSVALHELAICYLAVGDRVRAMAVLGSVLASEPDNEYSAGVMARLDRSGSRWVLAAMTARAVADPEARALLRSHVVDQAAGPNYAQSIEHFSIGGIRRDRINDLAFLEAMAKAGDPDLRRGLERSLRRRLLSGSAGQAALLFILTRLSGTLSNWVAASVVGGIALLTVLRLRSRSTFPRTAPILRRTALTCLITPSILAASLGNVALLIIALPWIRDPGHPCTGVFWTAAVFGVLSLLFLNVLSIQRGVMTTFGEVIPGAHAVVSCFVRVRRSCTALIVGAMTLVVAALIARGSDSDDGRHRSALVALLAVMVAALVVISAWSSRPRNALDRLVMRQLLTTTMRWPVIWALPSLLAFGVAFDLDLFPLLAIFALIPSAYFSLRRMWISAPLMLPGFVNADLRGQGPTDVGRPGLAVRAAVVGRIEVRRWVRAVQIWLGVAAATLVAAGVNLCIITNGQASGGPDPAASDVRYAALAIAAVAVLDLIALLVLHRRLRPVGPHVTVLQRVAISWSCRGTSVVFGGLPLVLAGYLLVDSQSNSGWECGALLAILAPLVGFTFGSALPKWARAGQVG